MRALVLPFSTGQGQGKTTMLGRTRDSGCQYNEGRCRDLYYLKKAEENDHIYK